MSLQPPSTRIAYLAPEIPALSATFVYEELLALERRGLPVLPVSVHRPAHPAAAQQALAERTRVLYAGRWSVRLVASLSALPRFGLRSAHAFAMLLGDMSSVGPWRPAAWKLGWQWLAGARLAQWLQEANCTHLHVHFAHVPTQIAMYASAFSGVPFTVTAHANDIFERGLLLPEKAARAQRLLTISKHNLHYLQACGVPAGKLAVVRCGVSIPARADRPLYQAKLHYRIGTLGRLVEKKGFDDLIHAVALLRDRRYDVQLSIAGDGPLRARLQSLVTELALGEHVRFEGALGHEAVNDWLRTLDVFALACKPDARGDVDGIPVVLMEAMSQRVPVVSTRLSGIPELVMHERTGLLAGPADPESLAQALARLLDDPALRAALAGEAARHVHSEFSQSANVDRLLLHIGHGAVHAVAQPVPST